MSQRGTPANGAGDAQSSPEKRYKLRESAGKVPSRYRDYVEDSQFQPMDTSVTYAPPVQRTTPAPRPRQPNTTNSVAASATAPSNAPVDVSVPLDYPSDNEEDNATVQQQGYNYVAANQPLPNTAQYASYASSQPSSQPRYSQQAHSQSHASGPLGQGTDLSDDLKGNLRKLKNVLKLPKARRFVFCEFFYSGVDQQLFLAENEFSQLMKESFPNLKCTKLRKPEWREVRRLIGKPRRCSQVFLNEERESLEAKRQKIRTIYNGTCTSLGQEQFDLPALLPRPPVVGMKIYARVRTPKDGIYAGTVDAVLDDGYRVVFDKDDSIPPKVIKDYEVMFDQPAELLSLNYFLEMNRANIRGTAKISPMSHLYPTPNFIHAEGNKNRGVLVMGLPDGNVVPAYSMQGQKRVGSMGKDEKVGNFPVRMLVILVKLCKVIDYKKQLITNLTLMNDSAERMNLLANDYPHEFKVQYSQLVLDIEHINKLFKTYLSAIQGYHSTLLPHLNEPQPADRPENLRKTSYTHAFQIVKHCNSELVVHVKSKHVLQLITSLTSIIIQLRTIGIQKKRFSACDLNVLSESLKQIRSQIQPQNAAAFQDCVEVHMKQIHKMMLRA